MRIPKGSSDCGDHAWYREDHFTYACMHCYAGRADRPPWPPAETSLITLAGIGTLAQMELGRAGGPSDVDSIRRLVGEANSAVERLGDALPPASAFEYRMWVRVSGITIEGEQADVLFESLETIAGGLGPVLSGCEDWIEVILSMTAADRATAASVGAQAVAEALRRADLPDRWPEAIRVQPVSDTEAASPR